jgi:anaerobic selenocysteine-containing dehydrogenase
VTTTVRTTCNRDCPDACGIVATVADGRIAKLQGDPDHPVTRGFLCYRTSRFLERQYDPDRVTHPMLRRNGAFARVSWDDALDLIAEKMLRIKSESGGAAILNYRSGGTLGMMKFVNDAFFALFGPCAVKSGDICSGAGDAAQLADFGEEDSNDLFDLLNAKTIVLWGKNPHVSNVHIVPVLKEAREKGARILMIDPVRHRGADLAELYVQPRPGGDVALALGVARRLFETGKVDPAAASYCDHLDAFRSLAFSRSGDAWAELADLRPEQVRAVADLYADGPSAILVGWGLQRKATGSATVRMIDALGAISGNLGISGGGVSFYYKRRGAFDTSFPGALGAQPPRRLAESLLGREILDAAEPAIRMVWVTAGNPVAMLPDSHTVRRALETRELTVVADAFLTDTARSAHVVLPTTTMLEDDDLVGAYGHHWLGEVRPVVPAPDGVKTDYAIAQALAARLGLEEHFTADVETWKRRFLSKVSDKGASLEAIRDGYVRNPLAPKVLFADRRFKTESGRVNLIHDADPEPARPTVDRPLLLMAFSTEKAQSSQWAHPRGLDGPAVATVHPASAAGFAEGAIARIESEAGSMDVRLKFDARQRRDVLLMAKGGWLHDGRCANALIPARSTDAGGGAVYYDTAVRLTARS